MTTTKDYKSALSYAMQEEWEARFTTARCFPLTGFLGAGGKTVAAVAVLKSSVADRDDAAWAAHRYVAEGSKRAGDGATEAKTDPDITIDAKNVELIYRLCRDVDQGSIAAAPNDPSQWKATQWSAFPGPEWMRKHMTSDQLAVLLNLIIEVKNKDAPDPGDISDEVIEVIAAQCNEHASTDIPESVLSRFSRTTLTHAVVLLSVKLAQARLSVDTLLKQAEAAEAAEVVEGEGPTP